MEIINLTMKDYKRMRKIIKNDHKSYQYTIDIEDREYPYDNGVAEKHFDDYIEEWKDIISDYTDWCAKQR